MGVLSEHAVKSGFSEDVYTHACCPECVVRMQLEEPRDDECVCPVCLRRLPRIPILEHVIRIQRIELEELKADMAAAAALARADAVLGRRDE